MEKKKITIINSVPVNGGDEALLYATIAGLNGVFDNSEINVLTDNPELARTYISYAKFDFDWEYAQLKADENENQLVFKIKKKIRHLLKRVLGFSYNSIWSLLLSSRREKRVYQILKNSDTIVLSAGGYIHDYYGYDKRLATIKFIHQKLKKTYIVFFQSVGPFWKSNNYSKLIDFFNNAHAVILRENYSFSHLKSIGYDCNNVVVSTDLAFYLNSEYGTKVKKVKTLKNISINFREWPYEEEGLQIMDKAVLLCKHLIAKGLKLHFISTCQGIKDYKDDSVFAKKIISLLDTEEQEKCILNEDKCTLDELIHKFGSYDAYIGMRLHGAILSLLAGTPALNIAYEDKTVGVYANMNLDEFCFSFKEDFSVWIKKIEIFFSNYETYLNNISDINTTQEKSVISTLQELKSII